MSMTNRLNSRQITKVEDLTSLNHNKKESQLLNCDAFGFRGPRFYAVLIFNGKWQFRSRSFVYGDRVTIPPEWLEKLYKITERNLNG